MNSFQENGTARGAFIGLKGLRVSTLSVVTETGMLQLWCVARDGRRWKLEFNVRESVRTA